MARREMMMGMPIAPLPEVEAPIARKVREARKAPKGIEGFRDIVSQLEGLKDQFPDEVDAIDLIIGSIDDLITRLEAVPAPAPRARARKRAPEEEIV